MKRKRYSVEQIVAAVRQHDLGVSAADIARKLGIAEQTRGGPHSLHNLAARIRCSRVVVDECCR